MVRSNPRADCIPNGVRPCPCRCRPPRIAGLMPACVASAPNPTNHSTDSPGTRPDVPSTSRLPCRRTGRRARSASQGDRAGSGDWLTAKTERAGASTRTNCTSGATAPRSGRIARLRRQVSAKGARVAPRPPGPRPQHLRPADVNAMGRYQTPPPVNAASRARRARRTSSRHRGPLGAPEGRRPGHPQPARSWRSRIRLLGRPCGLDGARAR